MEEYEKIKKGEEEKEKNKIFLFNNLFLKEQRIIN